MISDQNDVETVQSVRALDENANPYLLAYRPRKNRCR